MSKTSRYTAKTPDNRGIIHYTDDEHAIWHELIKRQMQLLEGRVAPEFYDGLEKLKLPEDRIPQPVELSRTLQDHTGWSVEPVPALINFKDFFTLLANKRFPAASFIRSRDEMEYLQEPDIFHEVFGHCTMLTHQSFADFTQKYGEMGLKADPKDRAMLARLYWFTVEFGLLHTPDGIRSYGGGINSSPGEIVYAIESDTPGRKPFDALNALRTPYRIDIFQTVYYVLDDIDCLFHIAQENLIPLVHKARDLGDFEPTFPPKKEAV